jgi:hypothetical protein
MKLEFIVVIACTAMVSSSLTIVAIRYCDGRRNEPPAQQIQTAISNFNHTLKLNTTPPLWPDEKGKSNDTN